MTNTLSNCITGNILERNISFNEGDLPSDTGVILLLDFVDVNSLFAPYSNLPYSDELKACPDQNSNDSLLKQRIIKYLLGYSTQANQAVLEPHHN